MLYPININIEDLEITIIGGGKVAYRKCINFLDFNKKIRVVSKELIVEFEAIKNQIEIIEDYYDEKYIKNSFIVIAATNDKKVNQEIGMYCKNHGKLVNVVDNQQLCNFQVPSHIKRGDLLISISTGGKSPSLSAKIRKELEEVYDDSYEEYINLLGVAREEIIKQTSDINERRQILKNLINLNIEELKKLVN